MIGTLLGAVGAGLLAACALPLLIRTIRERHARGVDGTFLGLWLLGELAMLAHVLICGGSLPVLLNYIANAAMVGVVGWYKWA